MRPGDRQPADLGLALRDPYPWGDLTLLVRAAETAGYRALFLPEVGTRDTLATLAALAGETDRLLLGTGVVPLPARSTRLLAMAAATVQERSGGRLLLGLGTGPSGPGALERLRAAVEEIRATFASWADPQDAGLEVGAPPEIWIAALGPRATALAGAIADGVLLNWCTPERVAVARAQVGAGAEGAGRDAAEVTLGVYLRAALAAGSQAAALRAAAEYGSYPAYARQFAAMGIDPGDPAAIVAGVMLTDAATAPERLDAYRRAGADLPVVYPVLPLGRPDAAAALATLEALAPVGH
jgi:alkanesulfonate monooxygenase SsuD/methylene tetrahydromethanopterin reductase-like flavin-dependent oxidoreductase (luciferase family)